MSLSAVLFLFLTHLGIGVACTLVLIPPVAGAALIDLAVYQRLGDLEVCYRCHTEFRGAYRRTAPTCDLHVADEPELEYARQIERR